MAANDGERKAARSSASLAFRLELAAAIEPRGAFQWFELSEGGRLPDEAPPPGPALRGSNAPLVGLFELRGDELLGAKRLGLPAPVVPLLPQLVAVQLDISEHHLDARQLGFGGR
jgi:hypothetical protein